MGGGDAGVVSDNRSRPGSFFFPLLDHSHVCLRQRFFFFLLPSVESLRVCVALGRGWGGPCLPSMVAELSPWESRVRATGRRTRPGLLQTRQVGQQADFKDLAQVRVLKTQEERTQREIGKQTGGHQHAEG